MTSPRLCGIIDPEWGVIVDTVVDWITFAIAVAGFLLSVYNFVERLAKDRRNVEVKVKAIYKTGEYLTLLVEFANHSQLGISIAAGTLNGISFGETARMIYRYLDPMAAGKETERTVTFPQYIPPLRAERFLFQMECGTAPISGSGTIRLSTTRGKITRSCPLPLTHENDLTPLLRYLGQR